jgi:urea transporter
MRSALRFAIDALLRPYGQIVFSRDPLAGLLVLLAIAAFPNLALATLGAVAVAAVVTLLFGLGSHAVREGAYACTAVLTTLAVGVFDPGGGSTFALVALGAALAVLFSASFEAVFAPVALPTHSLPFVASAWAVHLAARSLPPRASSLELTTPWPWLPTHLFDASFLDVPASLVFLHGSIAGLLVLIAIAIHSRIALILAVVGGAVAFGMRLWLRPDMPFSPVDLTASFNALLTAIALGGVWFVPQRSSIALAAGGSAIACLLTYALFPAVGVLAVPVLSLPFVIVTHLVLTAARRRLQDRAPRSAVPSNRPEETLARHLVWLRRYGDAAWLPFRLPFRGEWIVSQGHDGKHTHKGLWRHGLDFEGRTAQGKAFDRSGQELRDYACYGLPVVAAGVGTVADVVDGVADNKPGEINTDDNWGNVVVLAHGAGLYSVYAHLQARSIRVKPGDVVMTGSEIGRCGNSGRSPTPHLHFQVQRSATLGSPTIPADFGDVVTRESDGHKLANRVIPREGEFVRPVIRDEAMARALAFKPGMVFELLEQRSGKRERVEVNVDLLGRRFLESKKAKLYLDPYDAALVFVDFEGDPRSFLRFLLLSMGRVPLDQAAPLTWNDMLPRRLLLPGWLRSLADLVAVVAPDFGGIPVDYRIEREEGRLQVIGKARQWSTRATLSLGATPHRFEIEHEGRKATVEMRLLGADKEAK